MQLPATQAVSGALCHVFSYQVLGPKQCLAGQSWCSVAGLPQSSAAFGGALGPSGASAPTWPAPTFGQPTSLTPAFGQPTSATASAQPSSSNPFPQLSAPTAFGTSSSTPAAGPASSSAAFAPFSMPASGSAPFSAGLSNFAFGAGAANTQQPPLHSQAQPFSQTAFGNSTGAAPNTGQSSLTAGNSGFGGMPGFGQQQQQQPQANSAGFGQQASTGFSAFGQPAASSPAAFGQQQFGAAPAFCFGQSAAGGTQSGTAPFQATKQQAVFPELAAPTAGAAPNLNVLCCRSLSQPCKAHLNQMGSQCFGAQ